MRVVLDSNVLISAFATQGLCHSLFEACLLTHEIIVSETLLKEVSRNLQRRIKLPSSTVTDIIQFLKEHAQIDIPAPLIESVSRDPDDVHILGLAIASKSECIVTGDKDLLVIKTFRRIPIMSPRDFWKNLRAEPRI